MAKMTNAKSNALPQLPRIPKRKSAHIAEMITDAILSGAYPVGDRIPTEQHLAEMYGVSRNCVREGLSALRTSGVLESTPGSGTVVAALPAPHSEACQSGDATGKLVSHLSDIRTEGNLFDVWEARREVEATIASLAARGATRKSIHRLEYYIIRMEKALDLDDAERYLHAAREYHLAIARAADNQLLLDIIAPLIEYTERQLARDAEQVSQSTRWKEALEEHRAIAESIKAGDSASASDLVKAHFKHASEFHGSLSWQND